ncbi:MAG TPA: CaiB/BaiF CoA-transferase family protein [Chryseosolibacter sp.]|nr:CaiB/BaiF CoA-transferase family protein [Chryseosolibacter sp.]
MSQLKDTIVLELASVLAGPGVGQFFAELGAEVIKVENLKTAGDVTRSWKLSDERSDDRSAYFCSVNWGKQSIAVDLTRPEGRDIVRRLARRSHIVITSYKPGDAEKLGVDYATLSADHPQLIYGEITGYGSESQRVGYDAIIQAEAGFMYMNGEPGGRSLKMPVALMDILAGHQLKEGLLLAMLEKEKTGMGRRVEVSLIQAAVASLANQASNYLVAGQLPRKQGSSHPNIAPYGDVFRTADDQEILLAVGTDKQFRQLTKLLKISDISANASFETNVLRVRNRVDLNDVLAKAIRQFNAADLLNALYAEKIPGGLIRNMAEVMAQPEIQDILIFSDHFRGIRTYVAQTASDSSHLLPPPRLGEHTQAILEKLLKFSPNEVKSLIDSSIVQ